jgi:hypothetical protein
MYPFVYCEDILDNLCWLGVDVEGKKGVVLIKSELPEGKEVVEYAAEKLQQVASRQSKALYLSFQIAIKGTHKQHGLRFNRKAASKTAKQDAFNNIAIGKKLPPHS